MLSHGVPPSSETFHTLNTAQAAGLPNDQRGQHPALGLGGPLAPLSPSGELPWECRAGSGPGSNTC